MEIELNLKNLLNSDTALTPATGAPIYTLIDKEMSKGNIVKLDFSGMDVMTTAFLNACIGQLFNKYDSNALNNKLKIINISADDLERVKIVIKRAKDYFNDRKTFEDRTDNFLNNG